MKDPNQKKLNDGTKKYDVFVSYRRERLETARSLVQALEKRGLRVFFDLEELDDGDFNEELYEELVHERLVLSQIVLELGAQLRERGMRIDLVKWEYLDYSMGPMHKQEEYNRELATCDMVFVLFWRRFGEYTEEEFRMALEGMRNRQRPRKVVIMFKNGGSEVEDGLASFQDSLVAGNGLDVIEFTGDGEFHQKSQSTILSCLEEV